MRVTTIHKAKGLELDHVFIPGLSAKLFPEERSPDSADAYDAMDAVALKESLARGAREEEGRLYYVACTRARHTLTLSRSHYYRDNKGSKPPGGFWELLLESRSLSRGLFCDTMWSQI